MPAESTIITPLPAGVTKEAVTKCLQDHEVYIKMTCPQLVSKKHISGPAEPGLGEPCVYEIQDTRPIGVMKLKMTLTNVEGGIDAVIEGNAPTGAMTIRSHWRALDDKLEEIVEIDVNIIARGIVKSNIEKTHPGHHERFFAEAAKA